MSTRSLPHLRRSPVPPARHLSRRQPDRLPAVESHWIGVAVALAAIVIVWAVATAVHNAAEPRHSPAPAAAAVPSPCARAVTAADEALDRAERWAAELASGGSAPGGIVVEREVFLRSAARYRLEAKACRGR